jgi:hypothetical protein
LLLSAIENIKAIKCAVVGSVQSQYWKHKVP